jgi:CO/xanthine dehydrogenase FAD-binding subunit
VRFFGAEITLLYLRPRSLEEAVQALAESRGTILSGGTDFFPALGDRVPNKPIIDISAVADLKGIHSTKDTIRFGGRTTWREISETPLPRGFDGVKAAAREVGSIQIQNVATIAGNLCNASPAADGIPALLALDAEITLASVSGLRRIPLADFVLGNRRTIKREDEILSEVTVPRRLENSASTFLKLGSRRYLVISIAMVAVNLLIDERGKIAEALLAVGACSASALRLRGLEQNLSGVAARPGIGHLVKQEHLAELSPIDDARATAGYRREAALVLTKRALEACVARVA